VEVTAELNLTNRHFCFRPLVIRNDNRLGKYRYPLTSFRLDKPRLVCANRTLNNIGILTAINCWTKDLVF